jgi:thioredoxin 1
MRHRFRKGWLAITAVSLLGVGGLLIACRFTPGCPLAPPSDRESSVSSDSTGGEAVSTEVHAPRKVEYADEATFDQEVLRSDVPVLVDFYADWCPPCRALAPTLQQLAPQMPDAKIVKVNVDESPQLAARYGVDSIPNLKVFKDGQVTAEHVGLASKDQLRALVQR